MLFKLILESIIEPLSDITSFGFRSGRNCHQAISCLANYLFVRAVLDKYIFYFNKKSKSLGPVFL